MIVISDANIFIDLYNIDMLHYLEEMDFDIATTDLVFEEMWAEQRSIISSLKIKIINFEDNLGILYEAYAECTTISLSIQDYSLFFIAHENNYILMSNDKRLRNYAKANHVKVIGIFYIFDKLKEYEKMDDKEMLIKLEELKASNVRLEKLIDQWIKDNF